MNKNLKKLTRELTRQGFEVHTTTRGHLTIQQAGQTIALLAGTPSDWRSHRNGIARLRRAGFTYNQTF